MKPLRLTMQAFGPYAEVAQVDFRHVLDGGLFLIHGQTGAGKTSILDGICYALFGKSSGSERSAEGMRCDLAKPDLPTEVTLEFALGSKIYRVIRRPRQTLKKQRGDGLTTSNTKGDLFELQGSLGTANLDSDPWELIASGDKKTDTKVIELLGMSEEQFRQVVVLPQGQFRKFLAAGSDDREELLEALFKTSRYRNLSEKLSAEAQELLAQINDQKRTIEATQSSLNIEDLSGLESTLQKMSERFSILDNQESEMESRYKAVIERRDQARQASQARQELAVFEQKNSNLEKRAPEILSLQKKLDDNHRARPLYIASQSITSLEKELQRLQTSISNEKLRFQNKSTQLEKLSLEQKKIEEQKPEIEKLTAEQGSLREAWKRASELQAESDKAAAAKSAYQEAEKSLLSCERIRDQIKEQKSAAEAKAKQLLDSTGKLEVLKSEGKLLETQMASAQSDLVQLERIDAQSAQTLKEQAAAEEIFRKEDLEVKKLKMNFHLAQASRLAEELKEGSPCPVCGSLEHPKPASKEKELELVSPEQLEAAELKARNASDQLSSLKMKLSGFNEQKEDLRAKIQKHLSPEEDPLSGLRALVTRQRDRLRAVDQSLLASEAAQKELENNQRQMKDLEARLETLETQSKKLQQEREEKRILFESLRSRVDQLQELLPEDLRNPEAIRLKGVELKEKLERYNESYQEINRRVEAARQETTASEANLKTLESELSLKTQDAGKLKSEREALLAKSGFSSIEVALSSHLEENEARKLESEKRQLDDERAIVDSRLKELKIQLSEFPFWAFEFEARESDFQLMDQERAKQKAERLTLKTEIEKLNAAKERLNDAMKALAKDEERYKVIGKLAGVANGNPTFNLARVNFPRFVLATRLDDVLEQASRRLFEMSRGQFILRRSRTLEDKRKNAGLDLEVEDSFTGTARPTSSLSGGEGFLASLALALGLADVVQSRLGGVRLEAVFVDEGFGSLDPEALDLAMKTLSELKTGGRLVGVISHVPEMKEQIARRLVVRKTAQGSQVRWEGVQNETRQAL